jgi:hypothetical protein
VGKRFLIRFKIIPKLNDRKGLPLSGESERGQNAGEMPGL